MGELIGAIHKLERRHTQRKRDKLLMGRDFPLLRDPSISFFKGKRGVDVGLGEGGGWGLHV